MKRGKRGSLFPTERSKSGITEKQPAASSRGVERPSCLVGLLSDGIGAQRADPDAFGLLGGSDWDRGRKSYRRWQRELVTSALPITFRGGRAVGRPVFGSCVTCWSWQTGGQPRASLIIDNMSVPEMGTHAVGGPPQYASARDKHASCHRGVSLTPVAGEVPGMLGFPVPARQLGKRCCWLDRAGGPEDRRAYRSKPKIALAEINRIKAAGFTFVAFWQMPATGRTDPSAGA